MTISYMKYLIINLENILEKYISILNKMYRLFIRKFHTINFPFWKIKPCKLESYENRKLVNKTILSSNNKLINNKCITNKCITNTCKSKKNYKKKIQLLNYKLNKH